MAVVSLSQLTGGLLLGGLALGIGEAVPPAADLAWGAAAGLAGVVGLLALYRGLATGRMGVVAPVSALVAAGLPIVIAAATEGLPGPVQMVGFGFGLAAVWLLSRSEAGGALAWRDLGLPLASGLGFGLFFVCMDRANNQALVWPVFAARCASTTLLLGVSALTRQPVRAARASLPLIVLAGLLDASGNAFFALASHQGRLDVAAVLASLYPASTVGLASLVLKERLTRAQWAGVGAALAAVVFVSASS